MVRNYMKNYNRSLYLLYKSVHTCFVLISICTNNLCNGGRIHQFLNNRIEKKPAYPFKNKSN